MLLEGSLDPKVGLVLKSEYKESSQAGFNLIAAHASAETENKHLVVHLIKQKKAKHLSDIHSLVILNNFSILIV